MDFKKRLSKKPEPTKDATFRKVYLANLQEVAIKSPTDQVDRTRAMFDLWCDTVGEVDKRDPRNLDLFEEYLVNQKIIGNEA